MNKTMYLIKKSLTVTSVYTRGTGKNLYGMVVISASPASSFSFRSEGVWPAERYDDAVEKAILAVLQEAGMGEGIGAEFVLREVGWRDKESYWDSYYQAARRATEEILQQVGVAPA